MIDNNFDKILKEKLESYQEEMVDASIWEGIESHLNKKSRRSMVRKVSLWFSAAAACFLAGVFFFKGFDDNKGLVAEPNSTIAQVIEPTIDNNVVSVEDAASVEKAALLIEIKDEPISIKSDEVAAQGGKVEETVKVVEKQEEAANETQEVKATQEVKETKKEVVPMTEQIKSFEDAFAQSIPLGYLEDNEPTKTKRNTSISILSNVTSVASPGSIIVDMGPAHASSQSGKVAGNSSVIPTTTTTPKFFMPVALGLQFRTKVAGNFYVGAGLNYSYLVSQYDAIVNYEFFEGAYNQLHYVGIPVTLYYNFVNSNKLNVYASLGGVVDKCVSSRYIYGSNVTHENVSGLQYSANLGLGVEYMFTRRFGIYLDPSIAYFFDNKQPLSIRTAQPLQLKLELGFRFKI